MLIFVICADEIIQHNVLLHGVTFPSYLTLFYFRVFNIIRVTARGTYLTPEIINNFMILWKVSVSVSAKYRYRPKFWYRYITIC